MLRRMVPALMILISFLIDTAVIPVFYYGSYLVPLTLICVMIIAVSRGRMFGALYGMIAGILLDVTAGTLGYKLFGYLAIGFLYGFMLDGDSDLIASRNGRDRRLAALRRFVWTFILYGIFEIVLRILQYFSNAVWDWAYIKDMLLRILIFDVLSLLLFPAFHRILVGRHGEGNSDRNKREMKNY